jgi:hypothetical protein
MTDSKIRLQKILPVFMSFIVMGFISTKPGPVTSISVLGVCMLYVLWVSFYLQKR